MAKAGVVTLSERRRHIVPAEQRLKRVALDRDRVHAVCLQVVKDAPDSDGQIGRGPTQQIADQPFGDELVAVPLASALIVDERSEAHTSELQPLTQISNCD